MDMRTRSLVGWCISFAPNSRTIAMALHHAILPKNDPAFPQHGLPSSVYIDNGKDYRSKYLNGEEISIGRIDYPDIMDARRPEACRSFLHRFCNTTRRLKEGLGEEAWRQSLHGSRACGWGRLCPLAWPWRYATAHPPLGQACGGASTRTLVQSFPASWPAWCGSGHELARPEKLPYSCAPAMPVLTIEQFLASTVLRLDRRTATTRPPTGATA
jgi:hypothetical protein